MQKGGLSGGHKSRPYNSTARTFNLPVGAALGAARGLQKGLFSGGYKPRPYNSPARTFNLPVGAALEAARELQKLPDNHKSRQKNAIARNCQFQQSQNPIFVIKSKY